MNLFRCSNCRCLISYEDLLCPYCGSNVKVQFESIREQEKLKTKKSELIIGIITLLIAIYGATFAYFSATARNAENDVTVKSAYVSIYYDGGTEIKDSNLIPTTEQVALSKYKKDILPYNRENDGEIIEEYDN